MSEELVLFAPLDGWLRLLCGGWQWAGDLGPYHGLFSVLLRRPA